MIDVYAAGQTDGQKKEKQAHKEVCIFSAAWRGAECNKGVELARPEKRLKESK